MNTQVPLPLSVQLDIPTPVVSDDFRVPTDLLVATGNDRLLLELIETKAFQRLKEIRFLGAIDYRRIRQPNGRPGAIRYTRYEHSLGVMRLALRYCLKRQLPFPERRLVCTAALLHDIGHPPLSHSVESVFKAEFGLDHHTATEDIICGRVPLGKNVHSALRHHGVNVDELVSVVAGEATRFDGFFRGPINFDTIEGILRSYRYANPSPTVPRPDTVTDSAMERANNRDRDVVDAFWKFKDWVYNNIINSPDGVLADFACKRFLGRNLADVKRDSFFSTEAKLFQQLSGLRELLTSRTFKEEVIRELNEPVHYVARSYYINRDGNFFTQQDDIRYRHSRRRCVLALDPTSDPVSIEEVTGSQGVLFDEDGVSAQLRIYRT